MQSVIHCGCLQLTQTYKIIIITLLFFSISDYNRDNVHISDYLITEIMFICQTT